MKLHEFYDNLAAFIINHPEALELEVFTSIDDEGNGYNPVNYKPQMGVLDDGDFMTEHINPKEINAVCIN